MGAQRTYRIMISGGGTGGHIYPAISIAQALKEILSDVEILFVGAKGKMEMQKVPEAGFEIVGLWMSGIQRKLSFSNLLFPIKLLSSILRSFKLLRKFKPDAVVGVGGYASGPLLYAASTRRIPTIIQEQNSYAGLTNKWLSGRVNKICVAHDGMEKYFPKSKLVVSGNPVRSGLRVSKDHIPAALEYFDLEPGRPTLLILGGSLGARTINEGVMHGLKKLDGKNVQVIWQTGGFYFEEMKRRTTGINLKYVRIVDFIREMQHAYSLANVVISRAGALSIAELMLTGKPSILIPSPNVAEDHQTKNAKNLVERNAAIMVPDKHAREDMIDRAIELLESPGKQEELSENIAGMARPNAAKDIANEIIKLVA